ncbi:hypothetical protein [Bradyrhizobium sp. I71]|uniref:hypothetical protein n=1 Tax=Bradyrhizobium sp. I71 TaxID=2590772 RepID=UPI001EF989AF|nr:hypothetical protein [Bradyrhizobium sp. I71]ULK98882.1 hypothetical protein FJV43_03815 [Bradyrhizobium sp. I71]
MREAHLTRIEQANLIAGHAVSYATAFLDDRHNVQQLADNADRLFLDLMVIEDAETTSFLIPVKLLVITMMRTARVARDLSRWPRAEDRWHAVMASLVELVMNESRQLTKDRA